MQPRTRYQVGDKIGEEYLVKHVLTGGMGEVYLCVDNRNARPFALKTLRGKFLTSPKVRALFINEAVAWMGLGKHPNIVRCHYMEDIENQPFLILEWVAGKDGQSSDLRSLLRNRPLNIEAALNLATDICRGLVHASQKQPGIVHRDLTPGNILLNEDQSAKITDFGLARVAEQAENEFGKGLTERDLLEMFYRPGVVEVKGPGFAIAKGVGRLGRSRDDWGIGTPPYIAPEQWAGDDVDARADIYAVGCIIYELLTGRKAFGGSSREEIRRRHLEAGIPEFPSTLPHTLREVLSRCLAKERNQRFATFDELLESLTEVYREQFSVSPRPIFEEAELSAAEYCNRGVSYLKIGQTHLALADFQRAIKLDPATARYHNYCGASCNTLGRYDEALKEFDEALTLGPQDVSFYVNRAVTYRGLHRFSDSLKDLDVAGRLDPSRPEIYLNRAAAYQALERHEEAMANWTRAIDLNPALPHAYMLRGTALYHLQKYDEALADYDSALKLDPSLADAYIGRGSVYLTRGDLDKALKNFFRALDYNPKSGLAYRHIGAVIMRKEGIQEALQWLKKAVKLGDMSIAAFVADSLAEEAAKLRRRGQLDEALETYNQAIQFDPGSGAYHINRASVLRTLNRFEEALADYDEGIRRRPTEGRAYLERALVYGRLGRHSDALANFDRALELKCDPVAVYCDRGNTYSRLGLHDEAIADYQRAIQLNPELTTAYLNIGSVLALNGQVRQAVPYFEQAAQLGSVMGAVYARQSRKQVGEAEPPTLYYPAEYALDAFAESMSPEEMRAAVARFPFMIKWDFINAIEERFLGHPVLSGRLETLYEIREERGEEN